MKRAVTGNLNGYLHPGLRLINFGGLTFYIYSSKAERETEWRVPIDMSPSHFGSDLVDFVGVLGPDA